MDTHEQAGNFWIKAGREEVIKPNTAIRIVGDSAAAGLWRAAKRVRRDTWRSHRKGHRKPASQAALTYSI